MADPTRHPDWPVWRRALLALAADVGPDAALAALVHRAALALDLDPDLHPSPFWRPWSPSSGDEDGQNAGGLEPGPFWRPWSPSSGEEDGQNGIGGLVVAAWPEEVRSGVFRSVWLKGPGDVPPDVRLIAAWGEAAPKAARLKELDSGVAALFTRRAEKYEGKPLAYDGHLPICLADLQIGRRRE